MQLLASKMPCRVLTESSLRSGYNRTEHNLPTLLLLLLLPQARKLEGELDVKLASYAKLCSGYEASPGTATEQVRSAGLPCAS